jgi:hypothetical protein
MARVRPAAMPYMARATHSPLTFSGARITARWSERALIVALVLI